jgi:hypothetical protein
MKRAYQASLGGDLVDNELIAFATYNNNPHDIQYCLKSCKHTHTNLRRRVSHGPQTWSS